MYLLVCMRLDPYGFQIAEGQRKTGRKIRWRCAKTEKQSPFVTWYVCDDESSVVECGYGSLETAQGLNEIQLHFGDEIVAVTLESGMSFFVQNDDDVAWL